MCEHHCCTQGFFIISAWFNLVSIRLLWSKLKFTLQHMFKNIAAQKFEHRHRPTTHCNLKIASIVSSRKYFITFEMRRDVLGVDVFSLLLYPALIQLQQNQNNLVPFRVALFQRCRIKCIDKTTSVKGGLLKKTTLYRYICIWFERKVFIFWGGAESLYELQFHIYKHCIMFFLVIFIFSLIPPFRFIWFSCRPNT